MATTSPTGEDESAMHVQPPDNWPPQGDSSGPRGDTDALNGVISGSADDSRAGQPPQSKDYPRSSSADLSISGSKADATYREKQIKPNKVYVGGLPDHTRQEDLQSCFGKIGTILNIELKVGYGFVEFDTREAAEESVAKYHEGFFMGNKIVVEFSRGGGRTAKYTSDPGACFKCGQMGHWARECPNHFSGGGSHRRSHNYDAPLIDRIQPSKYPPPPPRDLPPYRDDYAPSRYIRDPRYDYPPPHPGREYRRASTPPRDYRDYPAPQSRSLRDYDRDYRTRGPPPPPRYDTHASYYPSDSEGPPGYLPRATAPPAPPSSREPYDRYDRRAPPPPPGDRYAFAYPPARSRTPPGGPPPRIRDDFERPPPHREYPPPPDYRGRPITPPPSRYAADYPPRPGSPEMAAHRYRRRSVSPPRPVAYDYPGGSGGFAGNGYSANIPGGSSVPGLPPRISSSSRDYPPRSGRDEPGGAYRRP